MSLAIEAGICMEEIRPLLLQAYGELAAEFCFELWSREQARSDLHRSCGSAIAQTSYTTRTRPH